MRCLYYVQKLGFGLLQSSRPLEQSACKCLPHLKRCIIHRRKESDPYCPITTIIYETYAACGSCQGRDEKGRYISLLGSDPNSRTHHRAVHRIYISALLGSGVVFYKDDKAAKVKRGFFFLLLV